MDSQRLLQTLVNMSQLERKNNMEDDGGQETVNTQPQPQALNSILDDDNESP
jgi:hypothetical protein